MYDIKTTPTFSVSQLSSSNELLSILLKYLQRASNLSHQEGGCSLVRITSTMSNRYFLRALDPGKNTTTPSRIISRAKFWTRLLVSLLSINEHKCERTADGMELLSLRGTPSIEGVSLFSFKGVLFRNWIENRRRIKHRREHWPMIPPSSKL